MISKKEFEKIIESSNKPDTIKRAKDNDIVMTDKKFAKDLKLFNAATKLSITNSDILSGELVSDRILLSVKLVVAYIFTKDTFYTYHKYSGEQFFSCKYEDIKSVKRMSNNKMMICITMMNGKEIKRNVWYGDYVSEVLDKIAKLHNEADDVVEEVEEKKTKKADKVKETVKETTKKTPAKKKENKETEAVKEEVKKSKTVKEEAKKSEVAKEEVKPKTVKKTTKKSEETKEEVKPETVKKTAKKSEAVEEEIKKPKSATDNNQVSVFLSKKGIMIYSLWFNTAVDERLRFLSYLSDKGYVIDTLPKNNFHMLVKDTCYSDAVSITTDEISFIAFDNYEDIYEIVKYAYANSLDVFYKYVKFDGKVIDVDKMLEDTADKYENNRMEQIENEVDWSRAIYKFRATTEQTVSLVVKRQVATFLGYGLVEMKRAFEDGVEDPKIRNANEYVLTCRSVAGFGVAVDAYVDDVKKQDGYAIAKEFGIIQHKQKSPEEIQKENRVNIRKQYVNFTKQCVGRFDMICEPHNGKSPISSKMSKGLFGGGSVSKIASLINGHKGYGVVDYGKATAKEKLEMLDVGNSEIGIKFFLSDKIPNARVLNDVLTGTEYEFLADNFIGLGGYNRYLFAFESYESFLEFYYDVKKHTPTCKVLAGGFEGRNISMSELPEF